MKKRILSLALALTLTLTLALTITLPASAATYGMPVKPDRIHSGVQNYWYTDGCESAGQIWETNLTFEMLNKLQRIEIFMPQREHEPSDPDGLVVVLGGSENWWNSTAKIPWKDGRVTINASDFPVKPSDAVADPDQGGYLVLIDADGYDWQTNQSIVARLIDLTAFNRRLKTLHLLTMFSYMTNCRFIAVGLARTQSKTSLKRQ